MARYIAPLSTYKYPNSFASCFANVLLPQLLQPSIAMIIFFAMSCKNKLPPLKGGNL
jgi:hypothetical protein